MAALMYVASTSICTPNSLSQEVGLALGAQAGEAKLRKVFEDAGFTHFRRATQTPMNLIIEARGLRTRIRPEADRHRVEELIGPTRKGPRDEAVQFVPRKSLIHQDPSSFTIGRPSKAAATFLKVDNRLSTLQSLRQTPVVAQ